MARSVARTLACAAILAVSTAVYAADLLPAAPQLQPLPPEPQDFSGWYLRGDIGVGVNVDNIGLKNSPDPLALGGYSVGGASYAYSPAATEAFNNTSLSGNGQFDVGVGYQFNRWLRGDVTVEYRSGGHLQSLYTINDAAWAGGPGVTYADFYRADVSSFITMANIYADIGTWNCFTPYVGAGLGWAHNTVSGFTDQGFGYAAGTSLGPAGGYFGNGSVNSVAWALMAGVDFNVTHNLKLELGYRYMNYGQIKTGGSNCLGAGNGSTFDVTDCAGGVPNRVASTTRLASNDFRLGLIWTLDDCGAACAPAPAPTLQMPLVRKY